MARSLTATYMTESVWELDFDLDLVAHWYVKNDTLRIKWNEGDRSYKKIDPTSSGTEDEEMFKYPLTTRYE